MLNKSEVRIQIAHADQLGFDYTTINKNDPFLTVMKDAAGGTVKRMSMKTMTTRKDGRSHVAYIAYDGIDWHLGCGNHFLEGKMDSIEAMTSVTVVAANAEEKKSMFSYYKSEDANTFCHFWKSWNKKGKICKHVSDLLAQTTEEDLSTLEAILLGEEIIPEPITSATAITYECSVAAKLNRYEHTRHICITGEKGSGKTRSTYEYLKANKIPHIFVGGNKDIEASDLRGMLLPVEKDGNKEFIWVDGPLTEAFRRASKGEKICLIIDELLRISDSGLSILIPSLSLDNTNHYVLPTGRIVDVDADGVGKMEVLKAPKDKFWVIATTNIGAGYDVTRMDDALEDRFEYIEHNNELSNIQNILLDVASKNGISASSAIKLLNFYQKMKALYEAEELNKLINLRHLVQIIEDCRDEKNLHDFIVDRLPKWVERDIHGKLLPEQIKIVHRAIDKSDIKVIS